MNFSIRLYLLAFMAAGCVLCEAKAALPAYSFTDFEADAGWVEGRWMGDKPTLRLIQGKAAIISNKEEGSGQILELSPSKPFATLFVDAASIAKSSTVFCEVLAKPAAVD